MNKEIKSLLILVIILSLLVVGLSSYLIYDKVIMNENNDSEVVEEETSQVFGHKLDSEVGTFIVNKDGNVYYNPYEKWTGSHSTINLEFSEENKKILGNYGKYSVETYSSNLMPNENDTTFEGYKLELSNISSAYSMYFGNGSINNSIIFIDVNGKISELYFEVNQDKINITLYKNVEGYNDIATIVSNCSSMACSAILIDRNNKQYQYFGASNN